MSHTFAPIYKTLGTVLTLSLTMFLSACGEKPEEAANRTLNQTANEMENISKIKDPTEQQSAYQAVLRDLNNLIEQYPATDIAVKLNTGQSIGNISIDKIEQKIKTARNPIAKKMHEEFAEWRKQINSSDMKSKVSLLSGDTFLQKKQLLRNLLENYSDTDYITEPDNNLIVRLKLFYDDLEVMEQTLPLIKLKVLADEHRDNANKEGVPVDKKIAELEKALASIQEIYSLIKSSETLQNTLKKTTGIRNLPSIEKSEYYIAWQTALQGKGK